jgi:hypothetical protein
MDETTEVATESNELFVDQIAVGLVGAIASVLAGAYAKKGAKLALAAYRAHRAAA